MDPNRNRNSVIEYYYYYIGELEGLYTPNLVPKKLGLKGVIL